MAEISTAHYRFEAGGEQGRRCVPLNYCASSCLTGIERGIGTILRHVSGCGRLRPGMRPFAGGGYPHERGLGTYRLQTGNAPGRIVAITVNRNLILPL